AGRSRPRRWELGCGAWSSLSFPFTGFFQKRQHALPLGPIAGAVLNDFLELDLALGHIRYEAEVLAHVVALLHAVQRLVRAHDRVRVLALRKRADHLQLLQRERLEGFLAPVEVGCDAAAPAFLRRRELARLERVG